MGGDILLRFDIESEAPLVLSLMKPLNKEAYIKYCNETAKGGELIK